MVNCTKLENKKEELYASENGRRIYTEIKYLCEVAISVNKNFDELIEKVINLVTGKPLTLELVEKAEEMLLPIKKLDCVKEMLYIAHAHIDMNWEWGWDETVAITLSTFRTTLDFMKQYDFTFGQSQASCYKIVEEYDEDMLEEIKERIKEGRWEVTASSWVEGDSNMPLYESQMRQSLYAKKYLSSLLGVKKEELNLSFEPDTFGHNAFTPEIFAKGGITRLYYGRGKFDDCIFRWKANSGAEILTYCEPIWYIAESFDKDLRSLIRYAPCFASKYNLDRCLQVIGIGDHGGGVTRSSLEAVEEMKNYPLLPKVRYGTYREFFDYLESKKDSFKEYVGEINPIFDGCYTSQARIKSAYKEGEINLLTTEYSNAMSVLNGGKDRANLMDGAWQKLLFNTFHDILPGSCVYESKVYALGIMQEASAKAESVRALNLRDISERIDLSVWAEELKPTSSGEKASIGAGVGYKGSIRSSYDISRSDGRGRVYVFFNQLPFEREEVVELPIYDWDIDLNQLEAVNEEGEKLKLQILSKPETYWFHKMFKVLIQVKLPPLGYKSVLIKLKDNLYEKYKLNYSYREQKELDFNLENSVYKAEFDNRTLKLNRIINKSSGKALPLISGGEIWLEQEDSSYGMNAWTIGRIRKSEEFFPCEMGEKYLVDIRQGFSYKTKFSSSIVNVDVQFENGALIYKLDCDFLEINENEKTIPLLSSAFTLAKGVEVYKDFNECGKPLQEANVNFSASRCVYVTDKNGEGFVLLSKDRYGFRYFDDKLSVMLLRQSNEPDKFSEHGKYRMEFAIIPVGNYSKKQIDERIRGYLYPIVFTSVTGRGSYELPLTDSYISINAKNSVISDLSTSGDGKIKITVRNYSENEDNFEITLNREICGCYLTNFHSDVLCEAKFTGKSFKGKVKGYALNCYLVELK